MDIFRANLPTLDMSNVRPKQSTETVTEAVVEQTPTRQANRPQISYDPILKQFTVKNGGVQAVRDNLANATANPLNNPNGVNNQPINQVKISAERVAELLSRGKNKVTTKQAEKALNQAQFEAKPEEIEEATETVEYQYKPGDTFGQVIKDLGMESGHGLWGSDGDVKFYEQQLREQGWKGGNIPIGFKFKLSKRK